MGLSRVPEEMLFYGTLTAEEKARMHPCTKAMCVMRRGDSPPRLSPEIPSGYDIPDDASVTGKSPMITGLTRTSKSGYPENDCDNILEAVPIVKTTLPTPEPQPKIEKNGIDRKFMDEKKNYHDPNDDPCIVKCVSFAQQCCECTIM